MHSTRQTAGRARPLLQITLTALMAAAIAACGGGGVGTDGTGAPVSAAGTISGFGSVKIGANFHSLKATSLQDRFGDDSDSGNDDTSVSTRCDDNPSPNDATFGKNCGLKEGMEAEVVSSSSFVAQTVYFGSSLKGPVDGTPTADQFTVLGQTVKLTADTIVVGTIAASSLVEVHGVFDAASGVTTATRVEVKSVLSSYRLRGVVSEKGVIPNTAKIGGQLVDFSGVGVGVKGAKVQRAFAALTDGQVVRVKLSNSRAANTDPWVVLDVGSRNANRQSGVVEVEGRPTDITSNAGVVQFKLNGVLVSVPVGFSNVEYKTSTSLALADALAADLVKVEVKGTLTVTGDAATLIPSKIEIKIGKPYSQRSNDGSDGLERGYRGLLTNVDATAKTFRIVGNDLTFSFAGANIEDKDRLLNGLLNGTPTSSKVEAEGYLAADGTTVNLVRIKLED